MHKVNHMQVLARTEPTLLDMGLTTYRRPQLMVSLTFNPLKKKEVNY